MAADLPITLLPDAVLGRIFSECSRQEGPSMTLVCRRFRDVFFSEPRLWRRLCLAPAPQFQGAKAWLDSKLALLRHVGGVVAELALAADNDTKGWRLAEVLLPLAGPQLSHLSLDFARGGAAQDRFLGEPAPQAPRRPAAVLQALPQRFPHLTALSLCLASTAQGAAPPDQPWYMARRGGSEDEQPRGLPLPDCTPGVLRQLSALTDLWVDTAHPLPAGLLESLPRGLMQLRLACWRDPLPGGLVATLSELTQLRGLELVELCGWCKKDSAGNVADNPAGRDKGRSKQPLQVPAPASFPHLRSYELASVGAGMQLAGTPLTLVSCKLTSSPCPNATAGGGASPHTFSLEVMRPQAGERRVELPQLLAALLPARGWHLVHLQLSSSSPLAAQSIPQSSAELAGLRSLHLADCSGAADWLGPLAGHAPGLTCLKAEGCGLSVLPPEVAALRGLCELHFYNNQLTEVPPGPYLSGLQSCDLDSNHLRALPAALAAGATSLQALTLADNPISASLTELEAFCFEQLPTLRQLDLEGTHVHSSDIAELRSVARMRRRRLELGPEDWSGAEEGDEDYDLYGCGAQGVGYDSSDSSDFSDGCPRYSWGGCAYASRWY